MGFYIALRAILYSILQAALIVALGYLLAAELSPPPAFASTEPVLIVVLPMALSVLTTLAIFPASFFDKLNATHCIAFLNLFPVLLWIVTASKSLLSSSCWRAMAQNGESCQRWTVLLDAFSLVTCRLARLDIGFCLLLSARGWLLQVTCGRLAYPEGMPLHRLVGWWAIGQSAVHSLGYLLFYLAEGGWIGVWKNCFPAALPDGRLGLVNFFGVIAFAVSLPLALYSLPIIRKSSYHLFQLLHLPLSFLFVLSSSLHDFQILYFAIPGLVNWYLGRYVKRGGKGKLGFPTSHLFPATLTLLSGTSGPWVELKMDCSSIARNGDIHHAAPRGQWASVRVVTLGREFHPLSTVSLTDASKTYLSALVSKKAGDWSSALVELAQSETRSGVDVEVEGVHAAGGGGWRFEASSGEPALLLLAGGTGAYGWLQGLAVAAATGRRCTHLVWCVRQGADYEALKSRLPVASRDISISVHVTGNVVFSGETLLTDGGGLDGTFVTQSRKICGAKALALGSLTATLSSIFVGHWVWEKWLRALLGAPKGVFNYAVVQRLIPVLLVVSAMALSFFGFSLIRFQSTDVPHEKIALLFGETSSSSSSSSSSGGDQYDVNEQLIENGTASESLKIHNGRPNLIELICEEAKEAYAKNKTELVIAACGPEALVDAARSAVLACGGECEGVSLHFAGAESHW